MVNNNDKTNKGSASNMNMAKKIASYSISDDILSKFNDHCSENDKNKSIIVEKMIISYLKNGGSIEYLEVKP